MRLNDSKYRKRGGSRRWKTTGNNNKLKIIFIGGLFLFVIYVCFFRKTENVSVNVGIEYMNGEEHTDDVATTKRLIDAHNSEDDDVDEELKQNFVEDEHVHLDENGEAQDGGLSANLENHHDGDDHSDIPTDIPLEKLTDEQLFENANELKECETIRLPPHMKKLNGEWWGVKFYRKLYRKYPIQNCVPKLRSHIQLTKEFFHHRFRKYGQPVLLHFENLRALGFKTRSFTIEELLTMFPYDPDHDKSVSYRANKAFSKNQEIDLGPAVYNLAHDGKLEKKKDGKRNFPRNIKIRLSSMQKLEIDPPPLINNVHDYQLPSLWAGTSTSPTPFHHDCCDNFVMMISGTKRFTLSPPTAWTALRPHCVGKMKALCYANIPNPQNTTRTDFAKMTVDVEPGQILYMPAGTFHHIQNLGPTIMVNTWTKGKETLAASP